MAGKTLYDKLWDAHLVSQRDDGTALTNLFSGRPARGLMNRVMRDIGPMSDLAPAFPTAGVERAGAATGAASSRPASEPTTGSNVKPDGPAPAPNQPATARSIIPRTATSVFMGRLNGAPRDRFTGRPRVGVPP